MKKSLIACLCLIAGMSLHAQSPSEANSSDSIVMVRSSELDSLRSDLQTVKDELNSIEAQNHHKSTWSRRRAWTIGYVNSSLSGEESSDGKLKSKFGVTMNFSNTYLLHPKPLLGMIRFGLDVIWTDLNFVKYESELLPIDDYYEEYERQQVEIGLGIGPSINIMPFARLDNGLRFLRASLYFHATPSASFMIMDDETSTAFNVLLNVGVKFSYRRLGLGLEGRWGSAKYEMDTPDLGEEFEDYYPETIKSKLKTSSLRAYISLNF